MAFTRKTYTGPVKNRGTIARGSKKLADVSKEELDAFRKKAGNEDLSYKEALRKLLNADRNAKPASKSYVTSTKPDVSKAKAGPAAYETQKAPPMDAATEARVRRNKLEQEAIRGEYMEKLPDNRPPVEGATFSAKGAPERKSPKMMTMPNKNPPAEDARFGDKSLSVNQRIKNDIKDNLKGARSSNTGTDKRSVTKRIKDSLGMMSGGKVKGYMGGGDVKGYGKARGAKACKMM
jgi:hypothetical protein